MSNAPITVAEQNWRQRRSSRNTDALIFVTMRGVSLRCVRYACMLCTLCVGIVHIAGKAPLFCTHVICAQSTICAELWLMVFRRFPDDPTICGPRERRDVQNAISGTFQRGL